MGCRIMVGREQGCEYGEMAVLFCSTTGVAFGPTFEDGDEHDAGERAEAFCRWLQVDARRFTEVELQGKYSEWLAQEPAQWDAEAAAELELLNGEGGSDLEVTS
jgi:hypothetical protein